MSAPEKPEDQDFSGFAKALRLTEKAVSDTPLVDHVESLRPNAAIWVLARQLERDRARLIEALKPFAALLQKHHQHGHDDVPVFAINDAKITHFDIRRISALLKELQ